VPIRRLSTWREGERSTIMGPGRQDQEAGEAGVCARRRDGSELPVRLTIDLVADTHSRAVFVATLVRA